MNFSKGFTLIELLVVIAIVGTMSSVVLTSLGTTKYRSNDSVRISQINQLARAIELYYSDNDKYPSNSGANAVFYMYADSRNPPRTAVPAYTNLTSKIVPTYMPSAPLPPKNNSGEGAMCGNCDEYNYQNNSYGRGYMICTYLAESRGGSGYPSSDGPFYGSNNYGPYYCVSSGCGAGSGPNGTNFTTCTN